MTVEKIGIIPKEKEQKYLKFAVKKVTQTLELNALRSKDFENDKLEQFPGAVKLTIGCVGVSGHDSMIDEAISLLWLVWRCYNWNLKSINSKEIFLRTIEILKAITIDNQWVTVLAEGIITD